ncbi:hypothetical protein CAEBREN_18698 [Caenorhabditis brenneri]|uniref:Uncharacterized protein n=1 Tax=Caenorhabditis brenneri TaxID=135651 RepID=G0MMW4_CAEBE|nr:hypothetical protein CAEBREN_18698 [Caenorhabditis brenneri]
MSCQAVRDQGAKAIRGMAGEGFTDQWMTTISS